MRAHDPAAAHLAGGAVEVLLAEAQAGEDLLGLGFEAVAAQLVEAVVDVVMNVLGVQRLDGMIGLPGLEDAAELRVFGRDGGGQFDDGFVGHRGAFLRQIADGDAAFAGDVAGIGGFLPENDGEKRGLAGAVRADQPDAVLAVHLERGVGEQNAFAVCLADAGQSQHEPTV